MIIRMIIIMMMNDDGVDDYNNDDNDHEDDYDLWWQPSIFQTLASLLVKHNLRKIPKRGQAYQVFSGKR